MRGYMLGGADTLTDMHIHIGNSVRSVIYKCVRFSLNRLKDLAVFLFAAHLQGLIARALTVNMTDTFDQYKNFKKKGNAESVTIVLKKFRKDNSKHKAEAKLENGNLKITADLDGDMYQVVINNVDIQPAVKVTHHKGEFEVTVTKNSDFSLESKFST